MKKITTLSYLITLTFLAACSTNNAPTLSENYELPLSEPYQSLIPAGYTIPDRLPAAIEDPHLLSAWIYLYNQTEPITIADGSSLTGRSLAEMVIEEGMSIQWGSDEICNGNSCARRLECQDLECVAGYQPDKVYPIYISQRYQDTQNITLARLAGSLAHELYHHSLPFGPVESSLYEEYWAYYVGAQIEQAKWAIFEGYDPHSSACLMAWFRVHGQTGYFGGDVYPLTLTAEVDRVSEVCMP